MEYTRTGSGPPLLLLPGLGCDGRMWQAVAEPLAETFTVVRPHTWGGGSLAERARALGELVRGLGYRSVGLAGLSMGGYLAFECLRQWPEGIRAAALLDTTAAPDPPERVETRQQVLRLLQAGKFAEVLGAFVPSVLAAGSEDGTAARQLMFAMGEALGAETFAEDLQAILGRGGFTDLLPRLRVPVLFAAGTEDALTPAAVARDMAAQVPGSRVVEIPGAGHMAPLENPADTARALGTFFASVFPA